jgi:extracellular elastinolytic metalloproteinase
VIDHRKRLPLIVKTALVIAEFFEGAFTQMKFILLVSLAFSKPVINQILPFGPPVETVSVQFDVEIPPLSAGQQTLSKLEIESIATEHLLGNVADLQVEVTASYSDLVHHVYYKQIYKGKPVANGFGAVHLTSQGKVVSFSHSFGTLDDKFSIFRPWELLSFGQNEDVPSLSRQEAVLAFISYLGLDHKSLNVVDDFYLQLDNYPKIPVSQAYLFVDGKPILVWDIVIDLDTNWFHVQLDAQTGSVLQLVDWVSHSSFTVYPLGYNSPLDGERKRVVDPELQLASPLGWNTQVSDTGKTILNTDTQGNNVYAQSNPSGGNQWRRNHRPSGGQNLIFDFPLSLRKEPKSYLDAAIVNLFYLNNMIHDLFYLYGFNEPAGNFQDSNFKRGGRDGDGVIANCQDGSGTNVTIRFLTIR